MEKRLIRILVLMIYITILLQKLFLHILRVRKKNIIQKMYMYTSKLEIQVILILLKYVVDLNVPIIVMFVLEI